jgi:hypothetical protein
VKVKILKVANLMGALKIMGALEAMKYFGGCRFCGGSEGRFKSVEQTELYGLWRPWIFLAAVKSRGCENSFIYESSASSI